jgi:hypothetical protein
LDPLNASQRRRALRWSIAASTIALLLVPLAALPGPAMEEGASSAAPPGLPELPERLVYPALNVRHDPFARATQPPGAEDDADPGIVLPPNDGIAAAPIVRAVVLGEHPKALLEIDGRTRIVGVGARLRGIAIEAVTSQGIRLDDGERLPVDGTP